MQAFRLCRATDPAYDGRSLTRTGDSRSLVGFDSGPICAGRCGDPDDIALEVLDERRLPANWSTLDVRDQGTTRRRRRVGQASSAQRFSPYRPSFFGERNYVLNPAYPDFLRIAFADPVPFQFDIRLFGPMAPRRA